MDIAPGFYWLRRKDDGRLTVGEAFDLGGRTLHILGNDNLFDPDEIDAVFSVVGRIPPPPAPA